MRIKLLKKSVCAFLVGVLMLSVIPSFGVTSVSANTGDILAETFDAGTVGHAPSGWNVPNPSPAVPPETEGYVMKAVVDDLGGLTNKVLKFEKNAKSTDSFNIRKDIAPASKITLSYKVRI